MRQVRYLLDDGQSEVLKSRAKEFFGHLVSGSDFCRTQDSARVQIVRTLRTHRPKLLKRFELQIGKDYARPKEFPDQEWNVCFQALRFQISDRILLALEAPPRQLARDVQEVGGFVSAFEDPTHVDDFINEIWKLQSLEARKHLWGIALLYYYALAAENGSRQGFVSFAKATSSLHLCQKAQAISTAARFLAYSTRPSYVQTSSEASGRKKSSRSKQTGKVRRGRKSDPEVKMRDDKILEIRDRSVAEGKRLTQGQIAEIAEEELQPSITRDDVKNAISREKERSGGKEFNGCHFCRASSLHVRPRSDSR